MICVISSVLAGTRIRMGHATYSPHLFFFLIGQPGAGKSIIEHATAMLRDVIQKYKSKYKVAKEEYERKLDAWELEQKAANKENRLPNDALNPGEAPKYYAFHMPDTISRSKLLENTEAGAKYGGMMSGSEVDGLSSSVKQDTGKHESVLRAMAMNERIGQFYKSNLKVLKALPKEFTRDQFKIEYMKCHNVGRATITRRLDIFVKVGFIERVQKDYYRKTDKMSILEKDFIKESMSEIRGGK